MVPSRLLRKRSQPIPNGKPNRPEPFLNVSVLFLYRFSFQRRSVLPGASPRPRLISRNRDRPPVPDQFWFPNGAERQNCTVSAPPDILRPVQFSVSVPNRMSPSDLDHDFGTGSIIGHRGAEAQRGNISGLSVSALSIFKDHKTDPPQYRTSFGPVLVPSRLLR